MINLDLTPPNQRKLHTRRFFRLFFEQVLGWLTLAILIVGSFFILTEWIIQQQAWNISSRLVALPHLLNTRAYNTTATLSLLNDAHTIQTNITPSTPILITLLENVPSGVRLINLDYQPKPGRVMIQGTANNRDSLLIFEKQLRAIPKISEVLLPIESLTKQSDIPFTITARYNS